MLNTFKIIILTILCGMLFLSCEHCANKSKLHDISFSSNPTNPRIDSSIEVLNNVSIIQSDFDIDKFIERANSLLTSMKGKQIRLVYKIDTIKIDTNRFSPLRTLLPQYALIKKYYFDPGKGNRDLRFWIIDATYNNLAILENVFKELHHQSGSVNGSDDTSPGLTYSNDYVIRTNKKIFWLNSLCPFGFIEHQKLSHVFVQSLCYEEFKDSILCKCGQPDCGLKYP